MKAILVVLALVLPALEGQNVDIVSELTDPAYPKVPLKDLDSLKYLLEIVDQAKLNVSLVISTKSRYKNGAPKGALSIAMTFALNPNSTTQMTLSGQEGRTLLQKATLDKLPAFALHSREGHIEGYSNNMEALPISRLDATFGVVEEARSGFTWDDKNYISQYTFLTDGAETTKVVYGDLDIRVVSSDKFPKEEIDKVQKVLGNSFFTYVEGNFPQAVAAKLNTVLPGNKWQVVSGIDEHFYIKAKKYVVLAMHGSKHLVFAV